MRISALNRKLARDLWHLRGQVFTVGLIVASGIATYVTMRGAYEAIERAQQDYYTRYRFADVFAQLKRAPNSLASAIAALPGVGTVETRVVVEVNLDVPGLHVEELRDQLAGTDSLSTPSAGLPGTST